jgi:hypothetical protein
MQKHRLKREIIATVVGNQMVNMCGPTFVSRLKAAAGADVGAVVVGFTAAREILGVDGLWEQVNALDNKASADGQTALYKALAYALRSLSFWLARRAGARQGQRPATGRGLRAVGRDLEGSGRRPFCRRSSRRPSPSAQRPMSPTARPKPWPRPSRRCSR